MVARAATALLFFAVVGSLAAPAEARFFRSEQVPNGQKLDCGLCHTASNGDGPRNAFGTQIEQMGLDGEGLIQNQNVVWTEIYMLDADQDGFTNGYELGDPDGTWNPVDGDPSVDPSLPGDPDSLPCPNGSRHPDEECDGEDVGDATCESLGFAGGMLLCNDDCTFDTTMCMSAPDAGPVGGDDAGGVDPGADTGSTGPMPGTDLGGGAAEPDSGAQSGGGGGRYGPYFDNPPPQEPGGCGGVLRVQNPGRDGGGLDAGLFIFLLGCRLRRRHRCT